MLQKVLLVFLVLFCSLATADGDAPSWIPNLRMRQDYRQADAFIRGILEQHEQTFPGALKSDISFYTSFNRLSYVQQGVLSDLMRDPEYMRMWQEREPLTDIRVTSLKDLEVETVSRDFREWGYLMTMLRNTVRPRKGILYSLFNWNGSASDVLDNLRERLIELLHQPAVEPEALRRLTITYVLAASFAHQQGAESTVHTILEALELINESDLDYLHDPLNYLPLLAQVEAERVSPEEWQRLLNGYYDDLKQKLYVHAQKPMLKKGQSVVLREVHPNIAIFRGYVGNDCATSFSPGFVFTPYDRYYYAYSEAGEALGYVGLSLVTIEGRRAIYLHTIQGPLFNAQQVSLVMRGIQKAADRLGAERVVLGQDHNIKANINYSAIEETMLTAVRGHQKIAVQWHDQDWRKTIVKWDSTLRYDDPNNNLLGRELTFDLSDVAVESTQRPFVAHFSPGAEIPPEKPMDCGYLLRR